MNLPRTLAVLALATAAICVPIATPAFAATQQEADAFLAARDWSAAAEAYEDLLRRDRGNAANWYNLGRARHEAGDLTGARRAYETALSHNHATPGRVRYQLARVFMTQGRRDQALRQLQQLAGTPVTHRTLLGTAEFAPLQQDPDFIAVVERQRPCNTPEFHQFDFWLGEWDVIPVGATAPWPQNSITRAQEGCVVLEQYVNGAFAGMSISFYDANRQVWHQSWMSNQGGAVYLEGGLNAEGAMVMSDATLPSGAASTIGRTTWTPNTDGTLRQHWESSTDNGVTWTTVFDGSYVRRAGS